MTEKNELVQTIIKLKEEIYPDLPSDLVIKILEIEQECLENRAEAPRRIQEAITAYLKSGD